VIETMSDEEYVPDRERLRAFFQGSGIRSDAQAFGFLLGALWGKLVTIQAARGVNVKSNALSWLRRGALCGDDLPRLFAQTRMKLLEYEFHTADSADVLHEIARLGTRLGDRVDLDNDRTMYFLLLGQACAGELMPSKEKATS
jgi:CRISPR-associated protein Csh1